MSSSKFSLDQIDAKIKHFSDQKHANEQKLKLKLCIENADFRGKIDDLQRLRQKVEADPTYCLVEDLKQNLNTLGKQALDTNDQLLQEFVTELERLVAADTPNDNEKLNDLTNQICPDARLEDLSVAYQYTLDLYDQWVASS